MCIRDSLYINWWWRLLRISRRQEITSSRSFRKQNKGVIITRRTKILATLGPATDKPGVLEGILDAGVNVVRINFSHGGEEEHLTRVAAVRNYAKENNTYIGILMDLQGPKIRISAFKNNKVELKNGNKFTLCLLYTSPSPRDKRQSRMPSSA